MKLDNDYFKRILRIIEGITTILVLLTPLSFPFGKVNDDVKIGVAILGTTLTIIFLLCRWFLRREYTKSENVFGVFFGISFLFLCLYLLFYLL